MECRACHQALTVLQSKHLWPQKLQFLLNKSAIVIDTSCKRIAWVNFNQLFLPPFYSGYIWQWNIGNQWQRQFALSDGLFNVAQEKRSEQIRLETCNKTIDSGMVCLSSTFHPTWLRV